MDYTTARSFLQSIKKNVNPYKATVYIHGGETFLAPFEHLEKINRIVDEELGSTITNIIPQTNLMYQIDEKFVEFVRKEYNNQIGVSWDYGIRFSTGSKAFNEDLFFKNFKFLVDRGVKIAVAITVQRHLLSADIENILPLFEGANSLDFEFLTMFDEKTRDLKVSNDEWTKFYFRIVKYYSENDTTWSLPQVDLFTKSFIENKIFSCKCNCCQHRTFTLNCNGTAGLCPDETYIKPITTAAEMSQNWAAFELKARGEYFEHLAQEMNPLCQSCEFFDYCGGNCEKALFDDTSKECPLSKKVLGFQQANLALFKNKLTSARENLVELMNQRNL